MSVALYVIGGVVAALAAWVAWRVASVGRGARKRDARILRELAAVEAELRSGGVVRGAEIAALAGRPHLRRLLLGMLREHGKEEVFPAEHLGRRSEAEAALVYWMMHPNELQDPPAELQHVVTLSRDVAGKGAEFEIFRYKMPTGHWAGSEWVLGLAGPFFEGDTPYAGAATGWSLASDRESGTTPDRALEGYLARVGVRSGGA